MCKNSSAFSILCAQDVVILSCSFDPGLVQVPLEGNEIVLVRVATSEKNISNNGLEWISHRVKYLRDLRYTLGVFETHASSRSTIKVIINREHGVTNYHPLSQMETCLIALNVGIKS